MKILSLTIKNIGIIEDCVIAFDKPLLLFFGDIRQGKTTILNAVKWCFGGSFPGDILRHGTEEGSISLALDNGSITRSFYVAVDKTTKSRPIKFIRDGVLVPEPVEEIKKFLNPFLLDQEYLKNKSELERKRFFVELFGLSSPQLETEYAKLDREASDLRSKISGFGEIKLQPVEPVNIEHLRHALQNARDNHVVVLQQRRDELTKQRAAYAAVVETVRNENATIVADNTEYDSFKQKQLFQLGVIKDLEAQLERAKETLGIYTSEVARSSRKELIGIPSAPDVSALEASLSEQPNTTELESKLAGGLAQNVRHEQYLKEAKRADEKTELQKSLGDKEGRQRAIKKERITKLKTLSDSSGIAGLTFTDDGSFIYDGASAGMLSTSQIMKLSSELSAKYPSGVGLELIDRGESLGKSIFEFVNKAKDENKTILATIVGERPAVVPENIGVFVVSSGKIN